MLKVYLYYINLISLYMLYWFKVEVIVCLLLKIKLRRLYWCFMLLNIVKILIDVCYMLFVLLIVGFFVVFILDFD